MNKQTEDAKRILIVEDEEHLAVGIKFNLEAEGYRATTVGDGPSALRHVNDGAEEVDLILLDLMLPGMSGYDVCESLRDAGHLMPILLLSARTLVEDRTRGFDVGANQYLTKPFELDELLSRVKNLLMMGPVQTVQRNAPQRQNYQFAGFTVNFERFEFEVEDRTVRLTPLELKLLQYFIDNEGRVIPRQELLEKVWELPGHLHTRAPDQFIRRLRKLFELDAADPKHFLTIRDAGYQFVAKPDGESAAS
ncbi:MAG: two-component system alkaline phosphatase synthesis response regulator PhoP [Pirellulaceae bacterium]|jgi:two-component system alkaline phosphatase synthesis response regulator PhoP